MLKQLIQSTVPDEPSFGGLEQAHRLFDGQWGSETVIPIRWLAAAAIVICGLLLPLILHRLYRSHQLRSKPMLTFHRLASEVGLSLRDQWLLILIARRTALPSPLTLILSRATLHHHARRYAEPLPARRRLAVMRRIAAVRQLLYS